MHRGDQAISALFVFASPHTIGTKQSPPSLSLRVPIQSGRSNLRPLCLCESPYNRDEAISVLFVFASPHAIGTKQSRRGSLEIRYFPIRPPRPFGI